MNRNVKDYMLRLHMVSPGDRVICAVSGGKDSMALLNCMLALAEELEITVSAAHFDHRLRGEDSRRDAAFVENYCRSRDVPCHMGGGDVSEYAARRGIGIEEAARELRYGFLLGIDPLAKIATAHHGGDNAETVLMHMIRGSGLHGLGGIPPVRGRIIRPMLAVTPKEVETYLTEHNIPHVEDGTNGEDFYLRNRIRHHLLPLMEQENPSVMGNISRMTELVRQEDAFLDELAESLLPKDGRLSVEELLRQPEALQFRILRRFLSLVPQLSAKQTEAALELCKSTEPSARISLSGGWVLAREYDTLVLSQEQETVKTKPVVLEIGTEIDFGLWRVALQREAESENGENTLRIKMPEEPLVLRTRQAGDRIRLTGGTKKLGRHLIDLKVPAGKRDTLPVLAAGEEIVAVLPYTVAAPWRAETGSDSLILTVKERE